MGVNALKVIIIVGVRPNSSRSHPSCNRPSKFALHERARVQIEALLVHTGQHYDEAMSDVFFANSEFADRI